MTFASLMNWWNLLFAAPFAVAVIYLFIYTATGITFGEADIDADADVHVDADTDADGDAEHDAEHDGEAGADHGILALFSLIGLGRAPLSLLLMIFLILWGIVGLILNQLLAPVLQLGWLIAVVSGPLTLLIAAALTGIIARLMSRFVPMTETYARSKASLVGRRAEAISLIDEKFGLAAVRDDSGDLYQVPCRVGAGRVTIQKGAAIVLYDYDAAASIFYAALLEDRERVRKLEPPKPPDGGDDQAIEPPALPAAENETQRRISA